MSATERPHGVEITVRPAALDDAHRIGEIYDEAIAAGNATFAVAPHPESERRGWLAGRAATAPVFVADMDGTVVGWSAIAPFSHRSWFSGVGEYTVYVTASARGRGIGTGLLDDLILKAPAFGYWKLVGLIFPENTAGLVLARHAGFVEVGTFRDHGRLNGDWQDISIVERHLERPR